MNHHHHHIIIILIALSVNYRILTEVHSTVITETMEAKKNENYTVGVLALQGAFEEHQSCMEKLGCTTKQIKTPSELLSPDIDGLILPGGESTAMGLIGNGEMWETLQKVIIQNGMPTW